VRALIPGLSLAALLALSIGVQRSRDALAPPPEVSANVLYLASGPLVERLALSYDALLADIYWMRAIQHFGRERQAGGAGRYAQLQTLLDLATSLDPRFVIAYRFGALFLAEPFPGGAGRPDQGIALLEKGLRANPRKWEYLQDIGFLHYWQSGDFAKAAEAFTRAADIPGAPWWLRPLAATTLERGGDRRSSRFLWKVMLDQAQDDWQRTTASKRLLQLDALDDIDRLRALVDRYADRHGRLPPTWNALVRDGGLAGPPVDPSGTAYDYDPEQGLVTVAKESALHPLPVEPPRAGAPRS
jgi:tetratricopeptide (TPR) repeat protein